MPETRNRKLVVACLGVSHPHASGRVRALRRRDDIEFKGAADEDGMLEPFTRALRLEPRTIKDILADSSVDAVIVHSKSSEMVDYACRSMQAGKSVLVEKPGGRTLAELDTLRRVAKETGAVCQVGYNFRFSPAVDAMQTSLRNGSLGKVMQVRGHCGCSLNEASTSHVNQPGDMGGALFVIGCHVIDLLLYHFGLPETVNARAPKFPGVMSPDYREDAAVAIMNYPDMIASFDFFSWDPLPWLESWEISAYGTEGIMHARPLPSGYDKFETPRESRLGGRTNWEETAFPQEWSAEKTEYSPELAEINNKVFFDREMAAFVASARGEAPSAIPPSHAYDITLVIDALYRSSQQNGKEVRIERS
jgi:predicted dehydrogenase